MSMDHKAFLFDHTAFERELKPILEEALAKDDPEKLISFINEHFKTITDPYEGNPLGKSWERWVSPKDAHQYGDHALTCFYDPKNNLGLSHAWSAIDDLLKKESPALAAAALGQPCGPAPNYFDPGKMGAYFQSAEMVVQHLKQINALIAKRPALNAALRPLVVMLDAAAAQSRGLYVTF